MSTKMESETVEQVEEQEVREESTVPSVEVDAGVSVEADGLQETLSDLAGGFDVSGFKCAKCGLAHMHDTNKHRASDSFDMGESEAADMEYNPNCHCGVNELARHGADYGVSESDAASTAGSAPIPDETVQEMNEQFGGI